MTTIFLSYSHQDAAWAKEFTVSLTKKEIVVWQDINQLEPGQVLTTEVSQAIEKSDGYCILLSRNSTASWWVQAELSAAFTRRATDPSFRLFPILLEDDCLPRILSGLLYIDGRSESPSTLANNIATKLQASELFNGTKDFDWKPILTLIEEDQFIEEPSSYRYGGWSKSYAKNYLPLAFPGHIPDSVSQIDSITVTHWVIRGLCSMKRLILRSHNNYEYLNRIEKRLTLARHYLLKHFDGIGAGLIHMSAMGESIHTDVRHSATFTKALIQLSHERLQPIKKAINFSLHDLSMGDCRAPTYAERLHLVSILRARPDLRTSWMSDSCLNQIQSILEKALCDMAHDYECKNGNAMLFGHQEQWHMSGYYTWWVLDACGDILLESSNTRTQTILSKILVGLNGLKYDINTSTCSFPLTLHGSPDLGATAHIGEILLRLWPISHMDLVDRLMSYIVEKTWSKDFLNYNHTELIWAIPQFIERVETIKCEAHQ